MEILLFIALFGSTLYPNRILNRDLVTTIIKYDINKFMT